MEKPEALTPEEEKAINTSVVKVGCLTLHLTPRITLGETRVGISATEEGNPDPIIDEAVSVKDIKELAIALNAISKKAILLRWTAAEKARAASEATKKEVPQKRAIKKKQAKKARKR